MLGIRGELRSYGAQLALCATHVLSLKVCGEGNDNVISFQAHHFAQGRVGCHVACETVRYLLLEGKAAHDLSLGSLES